MRKSFTTEQKLTILQKIETGIFLREIAKEYGTNRSTIGTIKRNGDKIKSFNLTQKKRKRKQYKKIRPLKFPEVDLHLNEWFQKEREKKVQLKAVEIFKELRSNEGFSTSPGWLKFFKERHGIKLKKLSGEKALQMKQLLQNS